MIDIRLSDGTVFHAYSDTLIPTWDGMKTASEIVESDLIPVYGYEPYAYTGQLERHDPRERRCRTIVSIDKIV